MRAQLSGFHDFSHRDIATDGASLRVTEGGAGQCVLLLPGWPQSSYCFRKIMPALAERFRVVAIDPPGLGDSGPPSCGYDTASVAKQIVDLLDVLSISNALLVGFDVGAWIGYALAAKLPERFPRVALIDAAVPGLTPPTAYRLAPETFSGTWHFTFNFLPELPELLVRGKEREFLEWFFRSKSSLLDRAFTPSDIDFYARMYAREGHWGAALGYYRSIFESAKQNQVAAEVPLRMPVLAIGGASAMGHKMGDVLRPAAPGLISAVIPDCGHYVAEENPTGLLEVLLPFLHGSRLSPETCG